MKRFNQKLPFIFILLLLVSCRATETSVQVVKVEDKYEMKLPTSLTYQNNLYDQASLQYANPKEAFFVAVIDDNREELTEALFELLKDKLGVQTKKDCTKRFRLKEYLDVCYEGWVEAKMMRPSAAKITTTTIHRLPAMVVETTEQVNGNKVFYIVAVVETEKTYYQIFTWTLDSKKTQNEQQMKEIISSFREL